jgi:hypothetical protein
MQAGIAKRHFERIDRWNRLVRRVVAALDVEEESALYPKCRSCRLSTVGTYRWKPKRPVL